MYSKSCVFALILVISLTPLKALASGPESSPTVPAASEPVLPPGAVVQRGAPLEKADTCADPDLQPNWMPPTWNIQAGSEQCGALETDNLAVLEPMGQGVTQWTIATTAKYGFTPRLEVRWGLPGRIYQRGGGTKTLGGTTDQWFGALYHFHDQSHLIPDLAVDYAIKIPTANPAKGFGSGYTDHLMTFIASRDVGPNHIDFNVVGSLVGAQNGTGGAAQLGLGLTRTFRRNLLATLETFGGPQPGTTDRYGAVFLGGSWGVTPTLAICGGSIYSYTAGSPRFQHIFGVTYTARPGVVPRRGGRLSRVLGR